MSEEPAEQKVVAKVTAPVLVVPPTKLPDPPKVGDAHIAPTTTEEEHRLTAGQRKINLIWEVTQAIVAIIVTAATLVVAGMLAISDNGNEAAFLLLSNVFFMVVSTYFARTNHQRVGGVQKGDTGR